jgi:hypothetical protein
VDLHTDTRGSTKTALLLTGPGYGMDGISAVLGDCRKTFILFPPSDYNLSWMRRECHNQGKLVRGLEVLECGVIAELDSSSAIFIPSGWSHAVFTTEGGFLVSIDCVTKRTVWTFSQYLLYQLYLEVETKRQADCFFLFLTKVALHSYSYVRAADQMAFSTNRKCTNRRHLLPGVLEATKRKLLRA